MRLFLIGIGVAAIGSAACNRDTPPSDQSPSESSSRSAAATLAPLLDIGGGSDAGELSDVVGAFPLSDGRVVIANAATNELRVFDSTGAHLTTIGRRGGGPGEFYSLFWAGRGSADTLLAYDIRSRRLSWFAPNGEFVRSTIFDTGSFSGLIVGRFADGSFIVASNSLPLPRLRREGVSLDSISLLRFSPDGVARSTLAKLPAWEVFSIGQGAAGVTFGPPLKRRLHVVVCDSSIMAGFSDSARVWRIDMNRARTVVTLPLRVQEVSPAERSRLRKERIARASAEFRPRIAAAFTSDDMVASTRPFFEGLGSDANGALWVALSAENATAATQWVRVTPNGTVIDTIRLAPRSRIASVDDGRLLVVSQDDDDVEHVLAYRIPATPATPGNPGCTRGFYRAR